jgi:YggT family protein
LAWAAIKLFKLSIYLLMGALFVSALLSWTNPQYAVRPCAAQRDRTFLASAAPLVPPAGSFDFSVLVMFIILERVLIDPEKTVATVAWLESRVLLP